MNTHVACTARGAKHTGNAAVSVLRVSGWVSGYGDVFVITYVRGSVRPCMRARGGGGGGGGGLLCARGCVYVYACVCLCVLVFVWGHILQHTRRACLRVRLRPCARTCMRA